MMKQNSGSNGSPDPMFTKLSAFDVVQRAFGILFGPDLCTFITIGLLIFPLAILVAVVMILTQDTTTETYNSSNSFQSSTTTVDQQLSPGAIIGIILAAALIVPIIFLSAAATIRATAEIYAGERPQIGAVLQVGVRNICRLFCFGFVLFIPLMGLIFVGGMMVALVMGVGMQQDGTFSAAGIVLGVVLFPVWFAVYFYIMIPFQMAPPSLVLERTTVCSVVSRAWELSSGRRCDIFLATFILGFINFIVGLIPFVNLFWNLVTLPLSSILATVLFLNLRVEKEGLNRSGLRGELGMDLLDETELVAEKYVDESPFVEGKQEIV